MDPATEHPKIEGVITSDKTDQTETTAMDDQFVVLGEQTRAHPRGACLVAGCPCKDARIVSQRRAAFFAAMARRAGETADRIVAPEPGWSLTALAG